MLARARAKEARLRTQKTAREAQKASARKEPARAAHRDTIVGVGILPKDLLLHFEVCRLFFAYLF